MILIVETVVEWFQRSSGAAQSPPGGAWLHIAPWVALLTQLTHPLELTEGEGREQGGVRAGGTSEEHQPQLAAGWGKWEAAPRERWFMDAVERNRSRFQLSPPPCSQEP